MDLERGAAVCHCSRLLCSGCLLLAETCSSILPQPASLKAAAACPQGWRFPGMSLFHFLDQISECLTPWGMNWMKPQLSRPWQRLHEPLRLGWCLAIEHTPGANSFCSVG